MPAKDTKYTLLDLMWKGNCLGLWLRQISTQISMQQSYHMFYHKPNVQCHSCTRMILRRFYDINLAVGDEITVTHTQTGG